LSYVPPVRSKKINFGLADQLRAFYFFQKKPAGRQSEMSFETYEVHKI
jgi:hypothetical protein